MELKKDLQGSLLVQVIGAVVIFIAVAVLAGWVFQVAALTSLGPGLATMKVNTALCFILAATSMILLCRLDISALTRWVSFGCLILLGFVALLTLIQDGFGIRLGIDELFLADWQASKERTFHPGRMSVATAFNFLLVSAALALLWLRRAAAAQWVALVSGSLCFFALTGYLYGVSDLYQIPAFSSMAAHTAGGILLLSIGIMLVRPGEGFVSLFFRAEPGSQLVCRVLLPLVILTVLAGAVISWSEANQHLGAQIGVGLLVTFVIVLSSVAIWIYARHLNEAARQLRQFHKENTDLRTALDDHAIVAITDPEGKITYVNDKFCTISKYAKEELIGKDHRIVNSGQHSKEFFQDLWTTIESGQVWQGEIRNRAKDGCDYWVATTIVPFLDDGGKPAQYVAIRADITALKNAQEAIEKQASELARSNRDLEQFAYVASHDLQEPLRAVAGCVRILQRRYEGELDEPADELIGHVVDGASRMQAIIEGLLALSRVGTRGGEMTPVSSTEAVQNALRNLDSTIQDSGAEITMDELPILQADPVQLTLLFQNLIGNAIKFRGDQPPRIHIGAERSGACWSVSVKDNGIGIDPRYFERIFVIFQRLHTRAEYPGTGIGLAICQRIMERHGGTISVESTGGKGSVFRCSFPA